MLIFCTLAEATLVNNYQSWSDRCEEADARRAGFAAVLDSDDDDANDDDKHAGGRRGSGSRTTRAPLDEHRSTMPWSLSCEEISFIYGNRTPTLAELAMATAPQRVILRRPQHAGAVGKKRASGYRYARLAYKIDRVARCAMPAVFSGFNCLFWAWYLLFQS